MNIVLCSREEEQRALAHGIILCTEDEADFLMHYRTKGSVNGVRRYQNEDGSLTPEGYRHYGIGQGNRHKAKAEKLEQKVQKAQQKLDKHVSRSSSIAGRVFGNKKKQMAKEAQLKRSLEVAKAKQRLEEEKAKKQEERGLSRVEKDRLNAETPKTTIKDRVEAMMYPPEMRGKSKEEKKAYWDKHEAEMFEQRMKEDHEKEIEIVNNSKNTLDHKPDVSELKDAAKDFDALTYEYKANYGDEILSYVDKTSKEIAKNYENGIKSDKNYDDYNELQEWVTDRVYEYSGSWNADSFKPGSNAAKAREKYRDVSDKIEERFDYISKKTGYTFANNYKKLMEACKKDSVWKELDKAYQKGESELLGAILTDIGFRDTPENRSMLMPFAFID